MILSDKMIEAIELLKQEEFYLCDTAKNSFWISYNRPKHIRTDTMDALEKRGIVLISYCADKKCALVATLVKKRCK